MNTNTAILKQVGEMSKMLAIQSQSIGKIDGLVECQSDIKKCQAVMQNDLKHVIADNVEFKNGHANFKKDYYETKKKVENITFIGKIIAWLYAGTIGSLITYLGTK